MPRKEYYVSKIQHSRYWEVVAPDGEMVASTPFKEEAEYAANVLNAEHNRLSPPPPERTTKVYDVVRRALLEVLDAENASGYQPVEYVEAYNTMEVLDQLGADGYYETVSRDRLLSDED
jgi:hypothetical protein